MGRFVRQAFRRLIYWTFLAPQIFVLGMCGFVVTPAGSLRKPEDERPPEGDDQVQIAAQDPDENHDDRLRSHGIEQWLTDMTAQQRLKWSHGCFQQQQSECGIPVEPLEVWHAKKKAREAAARAARN